jgi:prepilin-type processing-associated H-X9-DG protein
MVWPLFNNAYQADLASTPSNTWPSSSIVSMYTSAAQQVNTSMAVPIFLCPSRRDKSAGPMIDYAGAYHGGIAANALASYVTDASGYNAIMDTYTLGPRAAGVTLTAITAGTSNTILTAHKSLQPAHYVPGGQILQDKGYAWTSLSTNAYPAFDHMRWADAGGGGASNGKGYVQDGPNVDENHFGGPHPGASPVLFADGSIRNYSYGYTDSSGMNDCAVFQALLSYNRGIVVTPP